MAVSIFFTMRQIIRNIQTTETDILESVRRIDDVIDGVPKEANQECGNILENLAFIREELQRLDEIAEQLDGAIKPYLGKGGLGYKLTMTDNGGVLVEREE
jgi:hypothetical protein